MAIVKSFKSKIPPVVEDAAFGALWNGSKRVSTKNALYDLLTSLSVEDISGFQEEVEDIIGALIISDDTFVAGYDDLEGTLLLSVTGRMPIRTVTDHAALNIEDFTLLVDSSASGKNTTVTLPTAAAAAGKIYHIVNTGGYSVFINPDGAELINGDSEFEITDQYSGRTIQSDGTAWTILSGY